MNMNLTVGYNVEVGHVLDNFDDISIEEKLFNNRKQFTENRLGPVSTGPTKNRRFDNQLRAPGHVDQSTKEEFSMDKQSDDRDSAITGYIRAREKGMA